MTLETLRRTEAPESRAEGLKLALVDQIVDRLGGVSFGDVVLGTDDMERDIETIAGCRESMGERLSELIPQLILFQDMNEILGMVEEKLGSQLDANTKFILGSFWTMNVHRSSKKMKSLWESFYYFLDGGKEKDEEGVIKQLKGLTLEKAEVCIGSFLGQLEKVGGAEDADKIRALWSNYLEGKKEKSEMGEVVELFRGRVDSAASKAA